MKLWLTPRLREKQSKQEDMVVRFKQCRKGANPDLVNGLVIETISYNKDNFRNGSYLVGFSIGSPKACNCRLSMGADEDMTLIEHEESDGAGNV